MAFGYAPVPESALHCQPAYNHPIGEIPSCSHADRTILTSREQVFDLDRCVQKMATEEKCSWFHLGSDQEKTFGPTIAGLIHQHIGPERLLLWDSKLRGGRPDLLKIVKETYHAWDAEGEAVHSALCARPH